MRSNTGNTELQSHQQDNGARSYWLEELRIEASPATPQPLVTRQKQLEQRLGDLIKLNEADPTYPSLDKRRSVSYLIIYKHMVRYNLYLHSNETKAKEAMEGIKFCSQFIDHFNCKAVEFAAENNHQLMLFFFFKQGKLSSDIYHLILAIKQNDIEKIKHLCQQPLLFKQDPDLAVIFKMIIKLLFNINMEASKKYEMIQVVLNHSITHSIDRNQIYEPWEIDSLEEKLTKLQELARKEPPAPTVVSPAVAPMASVTSDLYAEGKKLIEECNFHLDKLLKSNPTNIELNKQVLRSSLQALLLQKDKFQNEVTLSIEALLERAISLKHFPAIALFFQFFKENQLKFSLDLTELLINEPFLYFSTVGLLAITKYVLALAPSNYDVTTALGNSIERYIKKQLVIKKFEEMTSFLDEIQNRQPRFYTALDIILKNLRLKGIQSHAVWVGDLSKYIVHATANIPSSKPQATQESERISISNPFLNSPSTSTSTSSQQGVGTSASHFSSTSSPQIRSRIMAQTPSPMPRQSTNTPSSRIPASKPRPTLTSKTTSSSNRATRPVIVATPPATASTSFSSPRTLQRVTSIPLVVSPSTSSSPSHDRGRPVPGFINRIATKVVPQRVFTESPGGLSPISSPVNPSRNYAVNLTSVIKPTNSRKVTEVQPSQKQAQPISPNARKRKIESRPPIDLTAIATTSTSSSSTKATKEQQSAKKPAPSALGAKSRKRGKTANPSAKAGSSTKKQRNTKALANPMGMFKPAPTLIGNTNPPSTSTPITQIRNHATEVVEVNSGRSSPVTFITSAGQRMYIPTPPIPSPISEELEERVDAAVDLLQFMTRATTLSSVNTQTSDDDSEDDDNVRSLVNLKSCL